MRGDMLARLASRGLVKLIREMRMSGAGGMPSISYVIKGADLTEAGRERLAAAKRAPTGVDVLRGAVALFNGCNENFNYRYHAHDLLKLYAAYKRSEWDIAPDRWTRRELTEAIAGHGNGATGDRLCADCRDARPENDETDLCEKCTQADNE